MCFLSFFAAASLQVRLAELRHGAFDAIYSPGPNCWQVQVATAWFCQARQLELYRSGGHRPPQRTWVDWLKLAHRWTYAAVVSRLERKFYRSPRLKKVISESLLLARDLKNYYGLPPERTVVAHAGVNCDHFHPDRRQALRPKARKELGLDDDQFMFFFIGNDWLRKGLYHLMRALAHVPRARLMVVGLGAERPESWQQYSVRLGVADRVRYLPRRPDVLYYYAAADALVAPSVYDPFALMPLEAMACGLPTIISQASGVAEIVGAEDTLLISRPDNVAELSAAMRRLVAEPELRARLAANGLARARRCPWDRIYRATLAQLLEVALVKASARSGKI
jgi:UDP-glucose:(heptosyl)LPS alpha-1,3-glucosyltransferase